MQSHQECLKLHRSEENQPGFALFSRTIRGRMRMHVYLEEEISKIILDRKLFKAVGNLWDSEGDHGRYLKGSALKFCSHGVCMGSWSPRLQSKLPRFGLPERTTAVKDLSFILSDLMRGYWD